METENRYLNSQIEEYLENLIKSGQLKPGDRLPSERKIAQQFNVSISPVRQATRMFIQKGILVNEPRRGIFVKRETLSRKQTNRIGLLFCHTRANLLKSPYYGPIIHGIDEAANDLGKSIVWQSLLDTDRKTDTGNIYDMLDIVDGLIVIGLLHRTYQDIEETLVTLDKPVVVLDHEAVSDDLNSVVFDSRANTGKAIDLLVSLGHTRIVYAGRGSRVDPKISAPGNMWLAAYKNKMEERGLSVDTDLIVNGLFYEDMELVRKLLSQADRPTALFCNGALLVPAIIDTAQQMGLRVPEDLSVVTLDDTPEIEERGITTVIIPLEKMGQEGTRRLLELIGEKQDGKNEAKRIVLPGQVVKRHTHAVPHK
jgi:GntR family transcriptional regulator of arabinose operon